MELTTLPQSCLTRIPSPQMSKHYVHVNTHDIIEMMTAEGFTLASASAAKSRKRDPLYAKHQLDFRHPDVPQIEGATPRVLFTNAHDGTSAAKFMQGVYRFVCSNGMVVGSTYAKEVVRHSGDQARDLIERVRALSRNTGPLFAQIESWTRRELSESQAMDFAHQAALLRFGDSERFTPVALLQTRRADDEGRSLWRIFNRVQENATAGGIKGVAANGRNLSSKRLTAIDANTRFNSDLWKLAAEFA